MGRRWRCNTPVWGKGCWRPGRVAAPGGRDRSSPTRLRTPPGRHTVATASPPCSTRAATPWWSAPSRSSSGATSQPRWRRRKPRRRTPRRSARRRTAVTSKPSTAAWRRRVLCQGARRAAPAQQGRRTSGRARGAVSRSLHSSRRSSRDCRTTRLQGSGSSSSSSKPSLSSSSRRRSSRWPNSLWRQRESPPWGSRRSTSRAWALLAQGRRPAPTRGVVSTGRCT
mmetsp:Transcript_18014/g.56451  ORF Transcript_18014/g.56451 Transcript_18014/m.56451 type:complete len:225 (-) Transcript_18014:796-1470(-)